MGIRLARKVLPAQPWGRLPYLPLSALLARHGPVSTLADLKKYRLLHSTSEPWRAWSDKPTLDIEWAPSGASFDDSVALRTLHHANEDVRTWTVRLLCDPKKVTWEIATALVVTPGTAKLHVSHILSKLGVNSRTRAILRARELGLLPP